MRARGWCGRALPTAASTRLQPSHPAARVGQPRLVAAGAAADRRLWQLSAMPRNLDCCPHLPPAQCAPSRTARCGSSAAATWPSCSRAAPPCCRRCARATCRHAGWVAPCLRAATLYPARATCRGAGRRAALQPPCTRSFPPARAYNVHRAAPAHALSTVHGLETAPPPAAQYLAGLRRRIQEKGQPVPRRVLRIEREVQALADKARDRGAPRWAGLGLCVMQGQAGQRWAGGRGGRHCSRRCAKEGTAGPLPCKDVQPREKMLRTSKPRCRAERAVGEA